MVNETKYGVISDVHHDPRIVPVAIDVLKSLGAQKLLINGDIGEPQETLQASQDYLAFILNAIGESSLESYVQPGSHETFGIYDPVMAHFSNKHRNIMDVIKEPKVENDDHHLVFLPGSDWFTIGEFNLINKKDFNTGTYILAENYFIPLIGINQHMALAKKGIAKGIRHYQNIEDLKKMVTDPDKTIVVCHVPRRFNNLDEAVDMAYFAEKPDGSLISGAVFEQMIRQQVGDVPYSEIEQIAQQNNIALKRENRGNQDLKNAYEELGIKKAVSGHFHESGHRANDRKGNHVQEGKFVDELFWNSGHLDTGQTGILTVKDRKVRYQNIRLQDYIK